MVMQQEGTHTVHEGRNIKRIREILGIKQDALAMDLGISQQAISALEQKEALDRDMLEKVARALKVSPETIKNFSEENFINIIQNNYQGSSNNFSGNYYCTFNPIDKVVELYEALLKSEREKIALLERMLEHKK
jgi:transcriptional regulator with XRE-family HTH domain